MTTWFGLLIVIPLIWASCAAPFSLFPAPKQATAPTAEVLRDLETEILARGGP